MQQIPTPKIGLGTSKNTDATQCAETVAAALEMGYRHVDTAQAYDNEEYVGDGIAQADVDRDDIFLATKVDPGQLAHDNVLQTTRSSMERLGVDSLDLLYVHWPTEAYNARDTLPAFDELRGEGTIKNVGVSNFTVDLLDEARDLLDSPIMANQVEMHPLLQQDELVEYGREHDITVVAYSPLMRGAVDDVPELVDIAEKHGITPAQVSLAWLLDKDNVVPIPKATGPDHLRENFDAWSVELDPEDVERIDGIGREERLIDPEDAPWNWTG